MTNVVGIVARLLLAVTGLSFLSMGALIAAGRRMPSWRPPTDPTIVRGQRRAGGTAAIYILTGAGLLVADLQNVPSHLVIGGILMAAAVVAGVIDIVRSNRPKLVRQRIVFALGLIAGVVAVFFAYRLA